MRLCGIYPMSDSIYYVKLTVPTIILHELQALQYQWVPVICKIAWR